MSRNQDIYSILSGYSSRNVMRKFAYICDIEYVDISSLSDDNDILYNNKYIISYEYNYSFKYKQFMMNNLRTNTTLYNRYSDKIFHEYIYKKYNTRYIFSNGNLNIIYKIDGMIINIIVVMESYKLYINNIEYSGGLFDKYIYAHILTKLKMM
jgi:hypothetical protein